MKPFLWVDQLNGEFIAYSTALSQESSPSQVLSEIVTPCDAGEAKELREAFLVADNTTQVSHWIVDWTQTVDDWV